MVFTAPNVSSPASVEELASVFPPALAQELAEETGLRIVPFAASGIALPPSPVLAAHGHVAPTHVVFDSGAMSVHYVFDDVSTFGMEGILREVVHEAPPIRPAVYADDGPAPAGPSSAGPPRPSGMCAFGCGSPHSAGRCNGRRRSTPYPSAAERAASRASSHSSVDSVPALIGFDIPATPEPALHPANFVQAQERLQRRIVSLNISELESRLRQPREEMVPFSEVLPTVLAVYGRTILRGNYAAFKDFSSLEDPYSAIDSLMALVHQYVREEPFFHPGCVPPLGQRVFDFAKDGEAILKLIDACDRSVAACYLLKVSRREVSLAHQRASALLESGTYLDENTGCLARDVAPASDHPIRSLDARDIIQPLTHVVSYLNALKDVVEQSADVLTHYE
ncbi:hypothetical protein AURDEDRAFT_174748 [Auricularia subglabra TFB-10046 SS5]|nr:hypothetical protein AURDEDRAFT_174748 [Auricularia subglabra TFB-10046 SS5]